VVFGIGYARLQKPKARRSDTRLRERGVELLPKRAKRERPFVLHGFLAKLCLPLPASSRAPVEDRHRDRYPRKNAGVMFECRRSERIRMETALNEVRDFWQQVGARRDALLLGGTQLGGELRDLGPAPDRRRAVAIERGELGRREVEIARHDRRRKVVA